MSVDPALVAELTANGDVPIPLFIPGPRIGSLFSGYGGLDEGVRSVLGGSVAWHSEIEPAAVRLLEHHHPDVPNLGDITAVDWAAVEPVQILTGGFPCQDVSSAGRRAGIHPGTRSGLWSHMAYAIDQLRPELVVIENVRGLLSADAACDMEPCPWCLGDDEGRPLRALGAVLGDLVDIGYDARWVGLRAADIGAPHGRSRVFVTAWPAADASGDGWDEGWAEPIGDAGRPEPAYGCRTPTHAAGEGWGSLVEEHVQGDSGSPVRPGEAEPGRRDSATAADTYGFGSVRGRGSWRGRSRSANDDRVATDADRDGFPRRAQRDIGPQAGQSAPLGGDAVGRVLDWGDYGPAIRRQVDVPSDSATDILGHHVHCGELPDETARQGLVQEALRPMEDDGEPGRGERWRTTAPTGGRAILGEGAEDADLLAVDGCVSEPLGPREVHGRRASERQGTPLGVRGTDRPDPGKSDAGSSVPESAVRESCAPGAGHPDGEPAPAGGGEDALPVGTSSVGREPLHRPEDGSSEVPEVPGTPRPEPEGAEGEGAIDWGGYAPAIARWELILGRPAPAPTQTGARGGQQLSPPFVEWMMGLPEGHVTGVPGLSRNDQLRLLGNGVLPAQASAALRWLLASDAGRVAA